MASMRCRITSPAGARSPSGSGSSTSTLHALDFAAATRSRSARSSTTSSPTASTPGSTRLPLHRCAGSSKRHLARRPGLCQLQRDARLGLPTGRSSILLYAAGRRRSPATASPRLSARGDPGRDLRKAGAAALAAEPDLRPDLPRAGEAARSTISHMNISCPAWRPRYVDEVRREMAEIGPLAGRLGDPARQFRRLRSAREGA